jgi:hypothetical protein
MSRVRTGSAAMLAAALGIGNAGAVEPSATIPPGVEGYAFYIGNIERVYAFEGDFTGDGATDAIAFIYHAPPGGNAVYLDVSLFESVDGHLVHTRVVDEVTGIMPRVVSISPGLIEVTTTVPKPGEPRCCPTGEKRYTIRP